MLQTYELEVIVEEKVEYYLEADTGPLLSLADDENVGELTFFDEYRKLYDEDGYSPPKYLALDGVIDRMVDMALTEIGQREKLTMLEMDSTDGFEMDTCYVLPDIRATIKQRKLRKYKRTRYTVSVCRRHRVKSGSSSTTEEEEAEAKEEQEQVEKKRKRMY